jgi:tetratricopeptide (TPR) repeat protein
MMKKILFYLMLFTSSAIAQNQVELLVLLHDGKLNLVPQYGFGKIEKTTELKTLDDKFITDAIKQYKNRDSASIVYSITGWGNFLQGNFKVAMKRFNQAWLLDSSKASPYFGFSSILSIIKDNPDKFFETWELKIKGVDDPEKYYKIGLQKDINNKEEIFTLPFSFSIYDALGKNDLVLLSCNRLLELSPNDTVALQQRGHYYTNIKNWDKALIDLKSAIQYGNEHAYTFNDLGFVYEQLGDFKNATISYDKSSQLEPKFVNPIYNNALLQLRQGQYQVALDYIEKCLLIKDEVGQFYKTKGEILLKLNKKDEGKKALKKAKKLGDKDAEKIIEENKL